MAAQRAIRVAVIAAMLITCASIAPASSYLVAPNANATSNGNKFQLLVLGDGAGIITSFPWDLAASQLTPMTGDTIPGIGFRLSGRVFDRFADFLPGDRPESDRCGGEDAMRP